MDASSEFRTMHFTVYGTTKRCFYYKSKYLLCKCTRLITLRTFNSFDSTGGSHLSTKALLLYRLSKINNIF